MTLADLSLRPDEVRALYLVHLQQMHSAEHQLLDALPHLAVSISTSAVRRQLLANAAKTPERVERLEAIFAALGEVPVGPICAAMKALVTLSTELSVTHPLGQLRDMLLISVAKEMKHLGIVKYSMATTFARTLGHIEQAEALSQAQQEEVTVDRELTFFAENVRLSSNLT
ncbi:DUF892 family protein [Deinococcus altitudinis]|uniref:DUF892 family protein n=1 Tax=Deinococcus altitudinis TaxID=468914 RepID=UPI003891B960